MTDYIEELKNRNKKLKEMIESSKEELEELKKKKEESENNKLIGCDIRSIICDEPMIGLASFETVITETVFPIKIQLEEGEVKITKEHIKFILQQYENSKKESVWKRTWKSILRILKIA